MNVASAGEGYAFVLAGGGSLGAIQVGMLKALTEADVRPSCVIGASVGAINGAFYAFHPHRDGVARLERLWLGMTRADIFPISLWRSLGGLLSRANFSVNPAGLLRIVNAALPGAHIEDASVPLHVIATQLLTGNEACIRNGPVNQALLASAAIPGVFPPVEIEGQLLIDGGVANNTPISAAVNAGARRILILPTGMSCAVSHAPTGVIGMALYAINLLVMHQLIRDIGIYQSQIELIVVPPLCPLDVPLYDFSQSARLIERARESTERWLQADGLRSKDAPEQLQPHTH